MTPDTLTDSRSTWPWWLLGTLSAGVGLLALASSVRRRPNYSRFFRRIGAPLAVEDLASIQRHTESRGNVRTGLGDPKLFPRWAEPRQAPRAQQLRESHAAILAYDRNRDAYRDSPFPRKMWIFGSGGPYGLIPANALAPWRGTDALRRGLVHPYDVFNPWRATVFFADYVWRLCQRHTYPPLPHILSLKRGLASPTLMNDHAEEHPRSRTVRLRALEAARAEGFEPEVLYKIVLREWPKYRGATELVP